MLFKGGEKVNSISSTPKVNKLVFSLVFAFALIFSPFVASESAYAADDAWSKAGIEADGSLEDSSIYEDLDSIIYFIMAIGGFWVIACLLFAGMRLSAAQGNPQARTQGFIGLVMAAVGLFVIVKAYDIAGWVAGFGG